MPRGQYDRKPKPESSTQVEAPAGPETPVVEEVVNVILQPAYEPAAAYCKAKGFNWSVTRTYRVPGEATPRTREEARTMVTAMIPKADYDALRKQHPNCVRLGKSGS